MWIERNAWTEPLRRLAFYPTFLMYLMGVVVAYGVAADWISLEAGLIMLTTLAVLVVLVALMREVRVVHTLVDAQYAVMAARIDHLTEILHEEGIAVPPVPSATPTEEPS